MYKKFKVKLVLLTTLILFVSFCLLFGVTCIILRNTTSKAVVRGISDVEAIFSTNEEATPPPNGLLAKFYVDHLGNVTIISTNYDSRSFDEQSVNQLLDQVALKENTLNIGNIEHFYYKLVVDGEVDTLYGFDAHTTFKFYNSNVTKAAISLSVLFVLLCLLVLFFSAVVCKPILENMERQKRFISDASHELKTPLAIINASADVLKGQADEKWLNNIKEQTNRMNTLVNDMLSLAKLEESIDSIKKENFDISEEIINCALPFEALSFEKGARISYNVQENIRVNTDRNAVKLLVNILMDNACKYVDEKGKILVTLTKKKNLIVFSVFNTGSNVPDQDSARIFERFYRADQARSRENGGSGLGLAIAKGLANKNKWKIYADSKQGISMTVTVLF